MVEVTKPYEFEGPDGTMSLLDLFEGRLQLIVYHFMFHPEWEDGCPSCTAGTVEFDAAQRGGQGIAECATRPVHQDAAELREAGHEIGPARPTTCGAVNEEHRLTGSGLLHSYGAGSSFERSPRPLGVTPTEAHTARSLRRNRTSSIVRRQRPLRSAPHALGSAAGRAVIST